MTPADESPKPSIRYYVDAHIAKRLTIQLRLQNVDVVRCQEIGFDDKPDLFHFEYAAQEKRTIVTSDEDFLRLAKEWLAQGRFHAGVVYITHTVKDDIGLLVSELIFWHNAIQVSAAALDNDVYNQVIFIG